MNLTDKKYADYALVQEMMGTIDTVRKFDPTVTKKLADEVKKSQRLYLTGEGSSRIFPAKNAMRKAKRWVWTSMCRPTARASRMSTTCRNTPFAAHRTQAAQKR